MLKRWISFGSTLVLTVSLLLLCGCQMELPEVSETKTTRTELVLLDVDITTLLTKAEMEETLGVTLRDPQVSNERRTLFALAQEGGVSVSISVEHRTIEEFRNALPKVEGEELQAAPNLADEAWWLSSGRTLFLFCRGYTASIGISDRDADEETVLYMARQLAMTLCNRLPA